jgi:hypothetical protein
MGGEDILARPCIFQSRFSAQNKRERGGVGGDHDLAAGGCCTQVFVSLRPD